MNQNCLHLVLKHKWFEKIASGEKNIEYRECKAYWNNRFQAVVNGKKTMWDFVIFHDGYTNRIIKRKLVGINITRNKNDLNLPEVWELKLGDIIS